MLKRTNYMNLAGIKERRTKLPGCVQAYGEEECVIDNGEEDKLPECVHGHITVTRTNYCTCICPG
jgi:hypothetical protein